MDHSNSETESISLSSKHRQPRRKRYPHDDRTYSATSSATESVSDSVSHQESLLSVPSLYQYKPSETTIAANKDKNEPKLAFTSEELQITEASSSYSKARAQSPKQLPDLKLKRTATRHGIMPSITGNNAAATGNPQAHRSLSYTVNDKHPTLRARPTVTTILRQQHVLERVEKKEKAKLDSLMISNSVLFESDDAVRQKEQRDSDEIKTAEAKRLLQAKLAYERARAASRKVVDEKQKIAESTRQKEKEWQVMLEEQREAEITRRKYVTEHLQKSFSHSKRAFDEMLRLKQIKVAQLKLEMENLQLEAKQKQRQEEMKRQDRIQQIQASKLALKKTKDSMGNPNQFYRSIAVPETQIKLRLQKEEEKRKLEEARKKIQADKQIKSVKLIRAMKKIQSFETKTKKQAPPVSQSQDKYYTENASSNPFMITSMNTSNYNYGNNSKQNIGNNVKSEEINEMLQELTMLKQQNCMKKHAEEQHRRGRISVSAPQLKVIGGSNIFRKDNKNNLNSRDLSSSFYDPFKRDNNTSPFNKNVGGISTGGRVYTRPSPIN